MVERADPVFLLGRDETELARTVADLQIRGTSDQVRYALCDLLQPQGFARALDEAAEQLGGFDTVVVTAALFAEQETLETDAALRDRVLATNFVNTVHFCEEARKRLLANGGGTLCVFSSVAGDRARKPVVLYGAAKAGLSQDCGPCW
jgi:NAD(P)-dependent dehydrogenase (short-subunit alcohol dehydrogenase family)